MFEFFILTLVTWRISHILVEEDGPFSVFEKLRDFLEKSFPVFECFKCTSVWVGVPLGLLYTRDIGGIFVGLAFSTLSIFMYVIVEYFESKYYAV